MLRLRRKIVQVAKNFNHTDTGHIEIDCQKKAQRTEMAPKK
jgi:hypothetical protein